MMETLHFNLPLTFEQIALMVSQLPEPEQLKLAKMLQKEQKDPIQTHFASEAVLAKDWLNPEEETAWQNL
jgi:hypothetical protein